MRKFTKGVLIASGCFMAAGVLLGTIGAVGRAYTGEALQYEEEFGVMRNVLSRFGKWRFRRIKKNGSGIAFVPDGVEFDKDHEIFDGSFTDDSLRDTDIYRLDVEMDAGSLVLCTGDKMVLKKDGNAECQYYIEGDTFYLKQRCPVATNKAELRLTLPEGIHLEAVDIEVCAGEVAANGLLLAEEVEVSVDAGEITLHEVQADSFLAVVGAGSVTVEKLDVRDCKANVGMGSVCLQDGLVRGDLDAAVSMGDIQMTLRDFYENHDYDVNCSMGVVQIEADDRSVRTYEGLAQSMNFYGKNSGGESKYSLDCSMGSVYLKFEGRDEGAESADAGTVNGNLDSMDGIGKELRETGEKLTAAERIYGMEDNWPERIGRENDNTTAEDFSFQIQIAEPTTLIISCVTERGELDMEIEDEKGREIFEKDGMRTGEYEVNASPAGIYTVHFEAENHTGSFWIWPEG